MREMKKSKGTEEITTFPLYPYLLQGQQALPNCKPISVGHLDLWVKVKWRDDDDQLMFDVFFITI